MKRHTINDNGIEQLVNQFESKCKPSFFSDLLTDILRDPHGKQDIFSLCITDLEEALNNGTGDEIGISQYHTNSGHIEYLSVTPDGIDIEYDPIIDL